MPGPVFMAGDRVRLSTVEEEDLDAFARARSDPDIRRPLGIETPGNRGDVEEFFEESVSGDDSYWFSVVPADESDPDDESPAADESDAADEPVGAVVLKDVYEPHGLGELSYWILPEHQGERYGKEAVDLLLEYGFDELRLHRIQADCYASNAGSKGLLESLGFSQEGRFRDAAFLDGGYVDVLRYGLLADEWRVV